MNQRKKVSKTDVCLVVDGQVSEPRNFSLSEILEMDRIEVSRVRHACGSGDLKGEIGSCSGVLLTDIINGVQVSVSDHNDTKKMYIITSSNYDGYSTVFSWQELYNTDVGEGVLIVIERDGKKLYENTGRIDLLSSRDVLTGSRYVKNLCHIQIMII